MFNDAACLVELKNNGVSERIIAAIATKNPTQEPLTSDGLIQLGKTQFSQGFLLDLVNQQPRHAAAGTGSQVFMKGQRIPSEKVLTFTTGSNVHHTGDLEATVAGCSQQTPRLVHQ